MSIILPDKCLRGREDCEPLSQVASTCAASFLCCGHNDGSNRTEKGDRFRVCFKSKVIDEMSDWDEIDIADQISVLSTAISIDQHMRQNALDE